MLKWFEWLQWCLTSAAIVVVQCILLEGVKRQVCLFMSLEAKMTALFSTAESSVRFISPVCAFHHNCDSRAVIEGRHGLNRSFNTVKKTWGILAKWSLLLALDCSGIWRHSVSLCIEDVSVFVMWIAMLLWVDGVMGMQVAGKVVLKVKWDSQDTHLAGAGDLWMHELFPTVQMGLLSGRSEPCRTIKTLNLEPSVM